jgi:hypothetical protein
MLTKPDGRIAAGGSDEVCVTETVKGRAEEMPTITMQSKARLNDGVVGSEA